MISLSWNSFSPALCASCQLQNETRARQRCETELAEFHSLFRDLLHENSIHADMASASSLSSSSNRTHQSTTAAKKSSRWMGGDDGELHASSRDDGADADGHDDDHDGSADDDGSALDESDRLTRLSSLSGAAPHKLFQRTMNGQHQQQQQQQQQYQQQHQQAVRRRQALLRAQLWQQSRQLTLTQHALDARLPEAALQVTRARRLLVEMLFGAFLENEL